MTALVLVALVIGVLGLAVGSFLNVVIYRVPRGESIVSPPSHCPRCDSRISARHNVPVVGWLVLRGRCHTCALPISARYPIVEGTTGVLFALITLAVGVTALLPLALLAAVSVLTLSAMTFDTARAARHSVPPA